MHIRLYGSCGTDSGRSIAEVTDNIHTIGVVKPFYGVPNLPTNRKSCILFSHEDFMKNGCKNRKIPRWEFFNAESTWNILGENLGYSH